MNDIHSNKYTISISLKLSIIVNRRRTVFFKISAQENAYGAVNVRSRLRNLTNNLFAFHIQFFLQIHLMQINEFFHEEIFSSASTFLVWNLEERSTQWTGILTSAPFLLAFTTESMKSSSDRDSRVAIQRTFRYLPQISRQREKRFSHSENKRIECEPTQFDSSRKQSSKIR